MVARTHATPTRQHHFVDLGPRVFTGTFVGASLVEQEAALQFGIRRESKILLASKAGIGLNHGSTAPHSPEAAKKTGRKIG